jgi:S-adenosylmethionine hydrolase
MYGVAYGVEPELQISDLTHEIPQYDIWEASYRLIQTVKYWPEGSVFVSVVDPGVGSTRRSIVVKTTSGQYIVTPDNGTLTHVKRLTGIEEARIIDETVNRLPNSGESYTFHGRDIYAYTGARLAAGIISFEEVGPKVEAGSVMELPVVEAVYDGEKVSGTIDVLDVRFGSLWTNIPRELFLKLGVGHGSRIEISIENEVRTIYKNILVYAKSFADVYVGEPLVYVNSLDCMAVAINQGSFALAYNIGTGTNWRITIRKAPKLVYED